MTEQTHRWDAWNATNAPRYAHEKAIQFILRRFGPAERRGLRVFEPGCGTGRNLEFLAREGIVPVGRDVSEIAIASARQRLLPFCPEPDVAVADLARPGVADDSCDALICLGVLDAAGPEWLGPALAVAVSALRPGAPAMFLFASDRDFRVTGDNPLCLHGYSDAEVSAALAALGGVVDRVCMDRYVTTYENRSYAQDEHLITFQKAKP